MSDRRQELFRRRASMSSSPIGRLEYVLLIALVAVVVIAIWGMIDHGAVETAFSYASGRRWA